ncbi:MAG: high mobility group box domain-containing protein, partial [Linnemannia elongata]
MQQKARKKIREEGKVKRTSNCFILYRTHIHPIIVARYGHQNNKEISRLAGRYWKNEPESVKSFYRQQAAEEKVRHAALYPSYKYTPAK